MEVRPVEVAEFRLTEELIREAFWNHFEPGADEHFIAHSLRKSEDYVPELDLVAVSDGKLVGSIVHSKSKIETTDGRSLRDVVSFGPLGVLPEYRNRGIAAKLVRESLRLAKDMGFRAVIIMGDPRLYGRLGFRCGEKYDLTNAEGQFHVGLMAYPLYEGALDGAAGAFSESEAFGVSADALAEFDASFPAREKGESAFQSEFAVLVSLSYAKDPKYTS
ncbi:unnamed protein product [Effrenium voratum]|uniref:N-acetyltransferase domain-containing protein n=1 Tax=Effrenium voratum TaxID=2562239 RepID=A0AA36IT65_9DINO|nr:unnamed protein product [Effrenium voratum]